MRVLYPFTFHIKRTRQATGYETRERIKKDQECWQVLDRNGGAIEQYSSNRERASASDELSLFGIDHPRIAKELATWINTPPEQIGLAVQIEGQKNAILSIWQIETISKKGERKTHALSIALGEDGRRLPCLENRIEEIFAAPPMAQAGVFIDREAFLRDYIEPALFREMDLRSFSHENVSYSTKLIGWIEIHGNDSACVNSI